MQINDEITIEASAERVWEIIADLASYPQWNPVLREARGEIARGSRLHLLVNSTGEGVLLASPRITQVDWGHTLVWLDRIGVPGLLDSRYRMSLEPLGEGRVRLLQESSYRGALVPFVRRRLQASSGGSHRKISRALKRRAEEAA